MYGSGHRLVLFAAAAALLGAACNGGTLQGDHPPATAGAGGSPIGVVGSGGGGGGVISTGQGGGGAFAGAGMECGAVTSVSAPRIPPDWLIVLDASAAMNDDASDMPCSGGCGTASKWAQMTSAIERVVADTETTVNWGLAIFPDPVDACAPPSGVVVPVGPAHAAAIAAAIAQRTSPNGGVMPGGNAPVRGAEDAAAVYLAGRTDVSPKFVFLATAGAPSCPAGAGAASADDVMGTVQAITNAHNAGFPTTVLGIAAAGGPADVTLNAMARAGGNARPGPRAYYSALTDAAELTAPLTTLIGVAPPCNFAIPAPPTNDGTTSRADIRVLVDGTDLPQDTSHMNGWDYVDQTLSWIQIYGPACDTLLSNPPHSVTVAFVCGGIP